MTFAFDPGHSRRNVRLNTLINLRWLAVAGQTIAVVVVHFWVEIELPLTACLTVIALSAWANVALRMHYHNVQRLEAERVALLLAYDVAQFTVLAYLTGGLVNPFAFLILAPALLSAMALPLRQTLLLGVFAVLCSTVIAFAYYPVPWTGTLVFEWPSSYVVATLIADTVAIVFIGAFAWQIAEEARLLADALAATELVLAREQHLSQLDGLAAAAAHELGTPLATIAVIAKELEHALGASSPHTGDVKLLREQAQRCRDILAKLSALPADGAPFDRPKLSALVEEVIAPHRNFGIAIDAVLPPDRADEPITARRPAILYGLGNLVENAVDFAQARRGRGALERAGCRRHHFGRRAGLPAGDSGAHRRALCDEPPPHRRRERGERARLGLLHRENLAGALGREHRLSQPAGAGAGGSGARALAAPGVRPAAGRC